MRLFSFLLLVAFGLFACKNEANSSGNTSTTATTPATNNNSAAPAPAPASPKGATIDISTIPTAKLPMTINGMSAGIPGTKPLSSKDHEWAEKNFQIQLDKGSAQTLVAMFRAPISNNRQLVGLFSTESLAGEPRETLSLWVLDAANKSFSETPHNILVNDLKGTSKIVISADNITSSYNGEPAREYAYTDNGVQPK